MRQFSHTVRISGGIHAVPAALLAQKAQQYDSFITISKGSAEADASRALKVMAMLINQGDIITITAEGADEDAAADELEAFIKQNF